MASVLPTTGHASLRTFAEFWPYYRSQHRHRFTRAAHVAAVVLGATMLVAGILMGRPSLALVALPLALAIAWASHLLFEGNRPTSLRHPAWAFLGALKLCFHSTVDRVLRPGTSLEWRNLRYEAAWHLTRNPVSRARFRAQNPALGEGQASVSAALRRRGVASAPHRSLGVDEADWGALAQVAGEFERSDRVREAVEAYPTEAAAPRRNDVYMVTRFYPEEPVLAADDPYLRAVLAAPILDVVNSYFGLWSKLMSVDLWYSIPHDAGHRIGSQKWHRDPEDRQMLKVYFYFSDVVDGAGPMEYVEGSARAGGSSGCSAPGSRSIRSPAIRSKGSSSRRLRPCRSGRSSAPARRERSISATPAASTAEVSRAAGLACLRSGRSSPRPPSGSSA